MINHTIEVLDAKGTIAVPVRGEVNFSIPVEAIATSERGEQVAQIDIVKGNYTARFWVSVKVSPSGSPVVKVTANKSDSETIKEVHGSFLDLEARRADRHAAFVKPFTNP